MNLKQIIIFLVKCRQITFKFSVINAKPIGERTLPMEYLKCFAKPEHHTWESWVQFSNEKYVAHQKTFLARKADEEARQKKLRMIVSRLKTSLCRCQKICFRILILIY